MEYGGKTLDELSFSHIFDYNAIEQIANGLEKMVQSWSTRSEDISNAAAPAAATSAPEQVADSAAPADAAAATTATTPTTACSSDVNTSEALKNFAKVLDRNQGRRDQSEDMLLSQKEYVKVEPYTPVVETPQFQGKPIAVRTPVSSSKCSSQTSGKKNTTFKEVSRAGLEKKGVFDKRISNRVEEVLRRSVACRSQARSIRSTRNYVSSPEKRENAQRECSTTIAEECLSPLTRMCNGAAKEPGSVERDVFGQTASSNKLSPTPLKQHPFEEEEMQNLCALSDVEDACNFENHLELGRDSSPSKCNVVPYNDIFMSSSSYWRSEKEEKSRTQDCSFVNDTLYERADFSTSYEERPLKRKKEMVDVLRNSSYEAEHESAPVDEVGTAGPLVLNNRIDDRSFEQAKRKPSCPPENVPDDTKEMYKSKVEELQIALLECATEYEVKMVEMEMKMLQLKSKYQLQEQEPLPSVKCEKEWTTRRLENYRKHNIKLQREKEALAKEVTDMRKKERQIDLLRKNLEDSLQKVNFLQREMVKKEEELVDSQLKEKEAKAHLYQVEAALQQAEASRIDHGGALSLLTAVSQWLHGVKRASLVKYDPRHQLQIQQYEDTLTKLMEEYMPQQRSPQKIPQLGYIDWDALTQAEPRPQQDSLEINREVQALQDELERLACRRSTF